MFEIQSPKTWQAQEKMISTLEPMQVPNGTRPGVRKSNGNLYENIGRKQIDDVATGRDYKSLPVLFCCLFR